MTEEDFAKKMIYECAVNDLQFSVFTLIDIVQQDVRRACVPLVSKKSTPLRESKRLETECIKINVSSPNSKRVLAVD